jgi:hypothetical protein
MKTHQLPDDDEVLLDAILTDENWLALDDTLRHGTLASLRRQRLRRKVQRWTAGIAVLAVMLTASFWLIQRYSLVPGNSAERLAIAPAGRALIGDFTESELVAMFPKGSCLIAEVDGRSTFVVLDEKLAARGFRERAEGSAP